MKYFNGLLMLVEKIFYLNGIFINISLIDKVILLLLGIAELNQLMRKLQKQLNQSFNFILQTAFILFSRSFFKNKKKKRSKKKSFPRFIYLMILMYDVLLRFLSLMVYVWSLFLIIFYQLHFSNEIHLIRLKYFP